MNIDIRTFTCIYIIRVSSYVFVSYGCLSCLSVCLSVPGGCGSRRPSWRARPRGGTPVVVFVVIIGISGLVSWLVIGAWCGGMVGLLVGGVWCGGLVE